jgi:predicted RecB family nuclease
VRTTDEGLSCSPTDLANFLVCRHKTDLDLLVAQGILSAPLWNDPLADALRARGDQHERRYVESLGARDLSIHDLSGGLKDEAAVRRVLAAMQAGVDIIVQAPLRGPGWFGIADVLRRVDQPSALGNWSYEVLDTKLARETRGGTILQLCVYTELVSLIQRHVPEFFHVVTPVATEPYRFDDFAAFYRLVRRQFLAFSTRAGAGFAPRPPGPTYPAPVDHCEICRWWERCNRQRRDDDHLSFVAGLGRAQQAELERRDVMTLAALADIAVPLEFAPTRGSKETYVRLREQARVQVQARAEKALVFELLDPERVDAGNPESLRANIGLARLPEPSPGDLFLDLEGDPYAREGGREYLFGLGRVGDDGSFTYSAHWAFTDAQERRAFETVVDVIMATIAADPGAHIYHYASYEPAAFKRLMGRYASREVDIDALLRGERFVDLYGVVRRALRAGVESYSIKSMEPFYDFRRLVELQRAGDQRRIIEIALEVGTHDLTVITPAVREAVEGYNQDDCRSALELRNWLETLRGRLVAEGTEVPRPEVRTGEASEKVSERQQRVEALRRRLLADVPTASSPRTPEQQARYLLAYLLDWHRRESKASWWDYYRLVQLSEDELLDERGALAGLEYVGQVREVLNRKTGKPTGSVVQRYRYPAQEVEIRRGADLKTQDGRTFGALEALNRDTLTVDIRKGKTQADRHATAVFEHTFISPNVVEDAIYRIAADIADAGSVERCQLPLVRNLLLRHPPLALVREAGSRQDDSTVTVVVGLSQALNGEVLAVQGPPGSGKTFAGARMICSLVAAGKRVGVTATSHKVIRNLLDAVQRQASQDGVAVRMIHRKREDEREGDDDSDSMVEVVANDEDVLARLASGAAQVAGGTAWFWAAEAFAEPKNQVDVLFVDEAGQMSLANVLAAAQAARNLVLLGDPQQLEQPQKGSHPDGTDASALQHMLGPHKTMPADRGVFLPVTWRLAPAVCAFTSEVFYENKLSSKNGLDRHRLCGADAFAFSGAGLWVIEVEHDGCRNASREEAEVVGALVAELLAPGVEWVDEHGQARPMTWNDILVVAPYNAHVSRLTERLAHPSCRVGTVDRFQGQEAPVVIYSMATSRPEDAPRGMEFLYSLNRLNVATSRAKCACILVASPRLFEPECRTPRQMQLANALCRYREIARAAGHGLSAATVMNGSRPRA